jgi:hypothetical protein
VLRVDRETVLRFRIRASHLHERLPSDSLGAAAHAGLQDSAPRAGVISLYARADGVEPASWEDPVLAQIWFRGGADYIVPRADVGVFTLGALPRDAAQCEALERIADDALAVLDGRTLQVRDVVTELGLDPPFLLRIAAVTGRLLIRWNASKIWLVPNERPDIDPEDARRELARRFLRWFAPASFERFAWWTGVDPKDARVTWDALSAELVEVDLEGETRFVLESDEDALVGAEHVEGVRLIPHSDPLIKIDGPLVVRNPDRRLEVFPSSKVKTAFWPVAGALLVDGEIVGSWARQQRRVTVNPWKRLPSRTRNAVEAEALGFPVASKSPAEVRWHAASA